MVSTEKGSDILGTVEPLNVNSVTKQLKIDEMTLNFKKEVGVK